MKHIVAFVDAPDPDNFVMLVALHRLFPQAELHVALTGRPVKFTATQDTPLWDYDRASSVLAQEASAARIKNFLRHFGIRVTRVYDGGIAPRTLVPHHLHFADYYKFFDVDPLAAIRHSELDPQEDLIKVMLAMNEGECLVAVGGPMTGLAQILMRQPDIASRIKEVHAMFATWGNIELMQMGDAPRGAVQFNVACDPAAAHFVLMGLDCPIYLMPSEVTRVGSIGFQNAVALRDALPQNDGTRQLFHLYALWYDAAVRPRQAKNPAELIFIHDLVAAFSLDPALREQIYHMVPIHIDRVPYLPREKNDWGKVTMQEARQITEEGGLDDTSPGVFHSIPGKGSCWCQRYAAKALTANGHEIYLATLKRIFT